MHEAKGTKARANLGLIRIQSADYFVLVISTPMDLLTAHAIPNANMLNISKNPELDRKFGGFNRGRARQHPTARFSRGAFVMPEEARLRSATTATTRTRASERPFRCRIKTSR
jgi:hypothetical protein